MILSRQITSLLKLAECGSFSEAAKQLYISTSALIQQINLLEDEIGVPLVNRSWKGAELTDAGLVFCARMRSIVNDIEEARKQAQEAGLPADINIAYANNLQPRYIYNVYRLYNDQHPGKMHIIPVDFSKLIEVVNQNVYDACFIHAGRYIRESGLVTTPLIQEKPSLALPIDHPLASKTCISLSDLANMEIVLPEYGLHDSTDTFRDELKEKNIPVTIRYITDLIEAEIYCSEHCAARLCLRRVLDPQMVTVPIDTSARFGICLAYKNERAVIQKLTPLIALTKEFFKKSTQISPD